jgi:hypothetical protein
MVEDQKTVTGLSCDDNLTEGGGCDKNAKLLLEYTKKKIQINE